MIKCFVYK